MKRTCTFLVVLALASAIPAEAGSPFGYARGVNITRVDAISTGLVAIAVNAIDDFASCATLDPVNQAAYVIDITTDSGQALYANVLFAASSGAIVSLFGAGNCTSINLPNPPMAPINGTVENLGRISAPAGS
jgi:hypothetical protein